MPRITFGPRSRISPSSPGGSAAPVSGSAMRTSTPANGRPQLPHFARRQVEVEPVAGVRAERLGHPEQVRPRAGRRAGGRPGAPRAGCRRPSADRSAVANAGLGGEPGRLVGPAAEQGDPLALAAARASAPGSGSRLGEQRRAGDERRQQPAAEPARPEERHRDVERARPDATQRASSPAAAARRRAAVGVDRSPSGVPRLPEVKRTTRSSAGRTRASSARDQRPARPVPGRSSSCHTRRSDGAAGWRPSAASAARQARGGGLEVVEVARGRGTRARRRGGSRPRSSQLGEQLGRAQQRAERHEDGADAQRGERGDGPVDAVRREQPDPVALPDAGGDEAGGERGGWRRRARRT